MVVMLHQQTNTQCRTHTFAGTLPTSCMAFSQQCLMGVRNYMSTFQLPGMALKEACQPNTTAFSDAQIGNACVALSGKPNTATSANPTERHPI